MDAQQIAPKNVYYSHIFKVRCFIIKLEMVNNKKSFRFEYYTIRVKRLIFIGEY